ncbi:MAG: hypothetical protein HY896_02875, partial [Deltaproteobacteria bacterium]|nr:hypothetical protein [Deltaproteobacteria bacterium]
MRHRFRKGGVVLAGVLAIAFAIGTFLHMGPAEAAKPRPDGKIPYFAPKETITSGTFEVFLKEEGTWRKVASLPFDLAFREKAVRLGKVARFSGGVTVRLLKKGGGPAHIDAIFLSGKPPRLISGTSETQGPMLVSRRDFDVIDASEGTLEFTFPAPAGDAVLTLVARIQGEKISTTPFRFPLSNLFKPMTAASHFYSYRWKEGAAAFGPGGKALERTPQLFREFCRAGTGHPSGFAYGWVGNDGKNLYVRIDFTGDNTRDGDKDYAKVYVNTPQGLKEFKVSEVETRWGKTSFTYTDKVSYRHKVYDFAIPADEIGLPPDRTGGTLSLAFAAYGTEAASLSVVSTNPE